MANEPTKPQQRTATQRLDDLERALMAMYQTMDNMARDLMIAKDALKLLGNKTDAVAKAVSRGEMPTDDVISKIMVENNIEELREKITGLVNQGVLVASEEVTDRSFVVGREIDDQGKTVNPRLQFALSALSEDIRNKIKAGKIGDTITLQEGKLKFELLEIYTIQAPTPPQQEQGVDKVAEGSPEAQSSGNEDKVGAGESSGS